MGSHIHHIVPRHAGGTDDPSNLIELSIEDHAEAHKWLFIENGNVKDAIAWLALSGLVGNEEARLLALKETTKTPEWKAKHKEGQQRKDFTYQRKRLAETIQTPEWKAALLEGTKNRAPITREQHENWNTLSRHLKTHTDNGLSNLLSVTP